MRYRRYTREKETERERRTKIYLGERDRWKSYIEGDQPRKKLNRREGDRGSSEKEKDTGEKYSEGERKRQRDMGRDRGERRKKDK